MAEVQTCPRRMTEMGPWDHKEGLDHWLTDRWSCDEEAVKKKHKEYDEKNGLTEGVDVFRSETSDLWLWSWGPPRCCSFCGSIHPDDAMRLLEEGWEEELAKSYKAYLNPPGSSSKHQAFLASVRDPKREPGEGVPSIWSPTPPVKLYVGHLSSDQLARLNEIHKGNKTKA